jgi:predicted transcriptional regulator
MEGIVSDRDLLRAHEVPSTLLSSLMSKTVRTVVSGTSIRAAASILLKERIGALIVLDFKKNPIGIITNADILKAIVEKAPIELWA